jgi:hypothetical protein
LGMAWRAKVSGRVLLLTRSNARLLLAPAQGVKEKI